MNVKPGDLAYLTGKLAIEANRGKIVEVLSRAVAPAYNKDKIYWNIKTSHPILWSNYADNGAPTGQSYSTEGIAPDECLRPILPPKGEREVTEHKDKEIEHEPQP